MAEEKVYFADREIAYFHNKSVDELLAMGLNDRQIPLLREKMEGTTYHLKGEAPVEEAAAAPVAVVAESARGRKRFEPPAPPDDVAVEAAEE